MKGIRTLVILGIGVYAVILLRNWAKRIPPLQAGQFMLQIPPIPLKSREEGTGNAARLIFGSRVQYNRAKGYWELVIPPVVLSESMLAIVPDIFKNFLIAGTAKYLD